MPHKHKRRGPGRAADFDLPPSKHAKSLPTKQLLPNAAGKDADTDGIKKRSKGTTKGTTRRDQREEDDTPRAFARLMQFVQGGKRPRSGLDDGNNSRSAQKSSKKRKRGDDPAAQQPTAHETIPQPTSSTGPRQTRSEDSTMATMKIQPHERLSDFAARVNQSIPLTVPAKTSRNNDLVNGKEAAPRTKHERHLRRLQSQWRAEEEKRRTKEAEVLEDLEDRREEEELLWGPSRSKKRKRGKMANGGGGGDDDDDPWAEIARKRKANGMQMEQTGLHDVVTAPPKLERLKARGKVKDS